MTRIARLSRQDGKSLKSPTRIGPACSEQLSEIFIGACTSTAVVACTDLGMVCDVVDWDGPGDVNAEFRFRHSILQHRSPIFTWE